jgi:RNA polymerase sigma factor (sigma-70 family)
MNTHTLAEIMASRNTTTLSIDEGRQLAPLVRSGDRAARARMLASCLGLIQRQARAHARSVPHLFDDLVAVGMAGVLRAIDKFDESRDVKFHTYAKGWVRKYCQQLRVEYEYVVRPPRSYGHALGLDIRSESLAVCDADGQERDLDLPVEPLELDGMRARRLDVEMRRLTEEERGVLLARYERDLTLAETGQGMAVSGERVRQIEAAAFKKLRLSLPADLGRVAL